MAAVTRRAGIADALALTAEHAAHLRLGRRTQTVTPRQLEDSLAAMAQTLASASHPRKRSRPNCRNSHARRQPWSTSPARSPSSGATEADRISCTGRGRPWPPSRRIARIASHAAETAGSREARLLVLENAFRAMAMAMEFGFLFDRCASCSRSDFSFPNPLWIQIAMTSWRRKRGWRVSSRSPKETYRPVTGSGSAAPATPVTHGTALISWSGSMFEYLMPPLVMRAPAGSLLEQTDRLVVRRQIEYGARTAGCRGAFPNPPTMPAIWS